MVELGSFSDTWLSNLNKNEGNLDHNRRSKGELMWSRGGHFLTFKSTIKGVKVVVAMKNIVLSFSIIFAIEYLLGYIRDGQDCQGCLL